MSGAYWNTVLTYISIPIKEKFVPEDSIQLSKNTKISYELFCFRMIVFDRLIIDVWSVINLGNMKCACHVITEFCVHVSLFPLWLCGYFLIFVLCWNVCFQAEDCKCNGWKTPVPPAKSRVDAAQPLASFTDPCRSCTHVLGIKCYICCHLPEHEAVCCDMIYHWTHMAT